MDWEMIIYFGYPSNGGKDFINGMNILNNTTTHYGLEFSLVSSLINF
jgi:hypothetical protein